MYKPIISLLNFDTVDLVSFDTKYFLHKVTTYSTQIS